MLLTCRTPPVLAAIIAFVFACHSGAADQRDNPPADEPTTPQEQTVTGDEQTETETNRYEGRLEIDPIAGGKRFQGTWLVTDGADRFLLSYRPIEEYFAYVDRQVVVEGEEYDPDPRTQHIMADHLRVESMELADGETPIEPVPDRLPAPPLLEDSQRFAERDGLWTQVTGILEQPEPVGVGSAYSGRLRLEDDATLSVGGFGEEEARRHEGQRVTVIGRLNVSEDGTAAIGDIRAICAGRTDRCGMSEADQP